MTTMSVAIFCIGVGVGIVIGWVLGDPGELD